MRVLTLPLKGEYFDAIKAGAKSEQLRADPILAQAN